MDLEWLILMLDILTLINIGFAIILVLNERKNPAVMWAWLLVILIIPYIGFIIYIILGLDIRKTKLFINKMNKDIKIRKKFDLGNSKYKSAKKIDIYNNGQDKFTQLLKDIKDAKKYIYLQYYLVKDDCISKKVIETLIGRLKEGVEVKYLIDGMGSLRTNKKIFESYKKVGGKLEIFLPPSFFKINYRNHRKLVVIDGNIGYIGGLNVGDEYLGKNKKFGDWRDMHIRLEGNIVIKLKERFIMDWNFTSKEKIKIEEKYSPNLEDEEIEVDIISSGPDTRWSNIHHNYLRMISIAKKSIYIETPYFVPDESILENLRVASLNGIDVKIIVPSKGDHPFVYSANLSYLRELLECGVSCYMYKAGFLHSKMLIVDEKYVSIGTANMDLRSFKLNFEINAFIRNKAISEIASEYFKSDIRSSERLTEKKLEEMGIIMKIKEAISRLIAPLL